jgi:hypothetical protein
VLIAYPMVRYAIFSAISMLLVTALHPVFSFGIVMVVSVLAALLGPGGSVLTTPSIWWPRLFAFCA